MKYGISGSNQSLEDNYLRYMESSDPIRAFVETAIDTYDKSNMESKDDVYNAYVTFCIAKKLNPESQFGFSSRLTKEFGFHYERKSKVYYWIGLKLKDRQKAEEGQETF